MDKPIARILDANTNRAKEGLRVCEEIARFVFQDKRLSAELKGQRHLLTALAAQACPRTRMLAGRDARGDVGRTVTGEEMKRSCLQDIFYANIQRVKESVRVLEEFSKLKEGRAAMRFKAMRYRLYSIEQRASRHFNA